MKKIILNTLLLIFLFNQAFGQLTNSVNFSTGWNNALPGSVIPNGQQDDDWQVVALAFPQTTLIPMGYGAFVQNPWTPGPITPSNTKWISYDTTSMSNFSYPVPGNSTAMMTLRYTFHTCVDDSFYFNATIRCDNNVTSVRVDGISTGFTTSSWTTGGALIYNPYLIAGVHTVEVDVTNPGGPTGLNVSGTITSKNSFVIIDKANFPWYSCASACNDSCFWKVAGNSIIGGNNVFGTNTNHGIKLRTNAIDRGFIATGNGSTGGYLGWNTMTPTARLHVNCANGNTAPGTSDVRFENLEAGQGTILAINGNGYVVNSGFDVPPGGWGTFWNVSGNSISGGNNIFGTNSADDVILRTAFINRGIMTSGTSGNPGDDGRLGWQTTNPTAHLHINCGGGNPDDGSMGSDIRFEKLEEGTGYVLVIDEAGYVYKNKFHIDELVNKAASGKIEKLEKELEELKSQINTLTNQNDSKTGIRSESKLFQNSPNPFSRETVIEYYVHELNQTAYITVNDLNGRMLQKYPIQMKGNGNVTVHAQNMTPGLYLYSLIIDGKEVDTKRMVIDK